MCQSLGVLIQVVYAQSENYMKISFLPIFYLQEEKEQLIISNNSQTRNF